MNSSGLINQTTLSGPSFINQGLSKDCSQILISKYSFCHISGIVLTGQITKNLTHETNMVSGYGDNFSATWSSILPLKTKIIGEVVVKGNAGGILKSLNQQLTAPGMDGDAIGGTVNLVTRKAPYNKRFSVSIATGYNSLTEDPQYNGSVIFGNRYLKE